MLMLLTPPQAEALRPWFLPDRPGPLVGLHVLQTGNGAFFVDRWPDPRTVLVDSAGNYALLGDPDAIKRDDLRQRLAGFVETNERFEPLLRAAFPDLAIWPRVILELPGDIASLNPVEAQIRRLQAGDAFHVWGLSPEIAWITRTLGGPTALAASNLAWGAFVDGRLVAVACSFFCGAHHEDIGVVTEPVYRGLGLSAACAAAVCRDIQARGRRPSWSTSPDNHASLRVADKLGFVVQRHDRLFVLGQNIPSSISAVKAERRRARRDWHR